MANDISYFKVQGDDTQYSFNDADLESRIGAEEMGTEAQTITGAVAELAGKVGTLSNLTTDEQDNLVEAINEVDAHADTNASNIATNTSNIATNASNIATNTAAISALNSKWVVEKKTLSVPNVAAGATEWVTSSIAKSGYTAVGVVGWYFAGGTGNSFLFPYSMMVANNNSSVAVRNLSTTASSGVSMQIDVLYQKT